MAALGNYLENLKIAWLGGSNFPAAPTSYVRLWNGNPGEDGSGGTEVTTLIRPAGGVVVSLALAAGRATSNDVAVDFGSAANPATVTHWAIMDTATGAGNLLIYGAFSATNNVSAGENFSIAIGDLDLSGAAGAMADAYVHAILNYIGGTAYPSAPANIYLAPYLGNPQGAGVEKSGNFTGGRQALSVDSNNPMTNTAEVNFGACTVAENLDYGAIFDAAAAGNLILSGALGSTLTPSINDVLKFPIGNVSFAID